MKNSFSLTSRTGPRPSDRESGVALIIVLSVVVLMTIMVVGFLGRTSVERTSTEAYHEGNRSSFLTEAAVNIVRSQIDHAATELHEGKTVAWASQPGMVRSFTQDGDLLRAYKLYSDDEMVSHKVDAAKAASDLASWWSAPAHYVDLNAPVTGQGDNGAKRLIYPILDSTALDDYTLQDNSFSATGAPVNSNDRDTALGLRQRIPMPVKWLYVLEDGTTVAPTGSGSTATIPGATRANPIVGRIAFWTDDETSKLNINTASHGSFWDIPRVSTFEDRDRMARFQPARREFQRYPGHPAMTSLRPAFSRSLFPNEESFADFAYQIAPRIAAGGSEGGSKKATAPVSLDSDRLYSAVEELLYAPDRAEQLNVADIEKAKFFLTARSNAPEINLFNLPRMAIWPINAGSKTPSTLDQVIAFCSTINGIPYYFQRNSPSSSTNDIEGFDGQNRKLWDYVNFLLGQPFPGFGNATFASKYSTAETQQITTEIFDYIRSSNLYSTALGATPYTGDVNVAPASLLPRQKPGTRVGQVTPMKVGETKGFGRIPTISRAIFQLYISGAEALRADGSVASRWIPSLNTKLPLYSDDTSAHYTSWKSFLNGFKALGEGAKLQLLTTGIIYFDTFDPNLGYVMPRYNFEIDVAFSGSWSVEGLNASEVGLGKGVQPLDFKNARLKINLDHNHVYNAGDNSISWVFFPRVLGGVFGPQWLMQNYAYMEHPGAGETFRNNLAVTADGINFGKILNDKNSGYMLVSKRVKVHLPITPLKESESSYTLPDINTLPASEKSPLIGFSGGSMEVKIIAGGANGVGGETVQSYDFSFPSFVKPSPTYLDSNTRSPAAPNFVFSKDKQFPISADFRYRWGWAYHQHGFYDPLSMGTNANRNTVDLRLVQDGDVAVSLVPILGDKRLLAAKSVLGATDFQPQELYNDKTRRAAVDFRMDTVGRQGYRLMSPGSSQIRPGRILNLNYGHNALPDMPGHFSDGVQARLSLPFPPDFDNAPFHLGDDTYINRADEGSVLDFLEGTGSNVATGGREVAWYYDRADRTQYLSGHDQSHYFSPARQMPSAVMFGSLPTGVKRNKPWQTLLFRPDPGRHPGAEDPPDYALLDLFWMPVVEPYAISEPFSTNGKVNMNFQIMPFSYIYRATALHGVLESEEMLAIPNSASGNGTDNGRGVLANDEYKMYDADSQNVFSTKKYRRKINIPETLRGFQAKFNKGELFRSETQICALPMIPEGATWSDDFERWWDDYRLTGDNSRERVYAHILPRLTTRSNTFTIHYRAQSLKKRKAANDAEAALWDETKDSVTAESRGSRTIERYIDPNDRTIPDFLANPSLSPTLGNHFRWRSLTNREFTP